MASKLIYCGAKSLTKSKKPRSCGDKHGDMGIYQCPKCLREQAIQISRLNDSRYQFLRAAAVRPELEAILEQYYNTVPLVAAHPGDVDELFDKAMNEAMRRKLTW